MIAFSSFYLVMNQDYQQGFDQQSEEYDYADEYIPSFTGITSLDVIIQFYMIGLGELQYDHLTENEKSLIIPWFMYLMATFMILIIFMNMLIAIMGQTFERVTTDDKNVRLKEQLCLMNDHIWLVDLKKKFKNKKYLIRVSKVKSSVQEMMDNKDKLSDIDTIFESHKNQINNLQNIIEQRTSHQASAQSNLHKIVQENILESRSKLNKQCKMIKDLESKIDNLQNQNQTKQESNNKPSAQQEAQQQLKPEILRIDPNERLQQSQQQHPEVDQVGNNQQSSQSQYVPYFISYIAQQDENSEVDFNDNQKQQYNQNEDQQLQQFNKQTNINQQQPIVDQNQQQELIMRQRQPERNMYVENMIQNLSGLQEHNQESDNIDKDIIPIRRQPRRRIMSTEVVLLEGQYERGSQLNTTRDQRKRLRLDSIDNRGGETGSKSERGVPLKKIEGEDSFNIKDANAKIQTNTAKKEQRSSQE